MRSLFSPFSHLPSSSNWLVITLSCIYLQLKMLLNTHCVTDKAICIWHFISWHSEVFFYPRLHFSIPAFTSQNPFGSFSLLLLLEKCMLLIHSNQLKVLNSGANFSKSIFCGSATKVKQVVFLITQTATKLRNWNPQNVNYFTFKSCLSMEVIQHR